MHKHWQVTRTSTSDDTVHNLFFSALTNCRVKNDLHNAPFFNRSQRKILEHVRKVKTRNLYKILCNKHD